MCGYKSILSGFIAIGFYFKVLFFLSRRKRLASGRNLYRSLGSWMTNHRWICIILRFVFVVSNRLFYGFLILSVFFGFMNIYLEFFMSILVNSEEWGLDKSLRDFYRHIGPIQSIKQSYLLSISGNR